MTIKEQIARIDESVQHMRKQGDETKETLTSMDERLRSLEISRARVTGMRDVVVVGVSIVSALFSIAWSSIKMKGGG